MAKARYGSTVPAAADQLGGLGLVVGVGLRHGQSAAGVVAHVDSGRQRLFQGGGDGIEAVDACAVAGRGPDGGLEVVLLVRGQDQVVLGVESEVGELGGQCGGDGRDQVRTARPHTSHGLGAQVSELLEPVTEIDEVGLVRQTQGDYGAFPRLAEQLPLDRCGGEAEPRLQHRRRLQQSRSRGQVRFVAVVQEGSRAGPHSSVRRLRCPAPAVRRPSRSTRHARSRPGCWPQPWRSRPARARTDGSPPRPRARRPPGAPHPQPRLRRPSPWCSDRAHTLRLRFE